MTKKTKLVLSKLGIGFTALVMVFAFNSASSGFAAGGDTQPSETATAGAGDATTSATVVVPPWCGWNINPVTTSIVLSPAGGAKYTGPELALSGTTSVVNAYVGGTASATEALPDDNCSWFGMTPNSAAFEVATSSAGFTAASSASSLADKADPAMNWLLSDKSLDIVNNFADDCVVQGFSPNKTASFTGIGNSVAWSIPSSEVGTFDFCSYSVTYTATIPANKIPTYGDSTYTFTGPTLIHTLKTDTPSAP